MMLIAMAKTDMFKRKSTALLIAFGLIAVFLTGGFGYLITQFPNGIVTGDINAIHGMLVYILTFVAFLGALSIVNIWFNVLIFSNSLVTREKVDSTYELSIAIAQKLEELKK
jgi:hypothetical protein